MSCSKRSQRKRDRKTERVGEKQTDRETDRKAERKTGGGKKVGTQKTYEKTIIQNFGKYFIGQGVLISTESLTLSLRDCSTLGTCGNTSYSEDTYVMMDFSSGWGTSTSEYKIRYMQKSNTVQNV